MPAGRSSGAARWFCLQEAKAKRGGGWIAWPVENPSGPGGAAGAHSAHKAWAGALGPRPCFGFAGLGPYGPQARKTPPPRRRAPQRLPPPPRQHTAVGPTAVARGDAGSRFSVGGNPGGGRRLGAKRPERASPGPKAPGSLFCLAGRGGGPQGRPLGRQTPPPQRPTERPSGAAAFRGRGHRPRPRNMPAAGLARQRAGGLCPPAAAPPLRFPPTPKRQRKSPAIRPTQPRSVHRPKKGGGDRKPCG